MAKGVSIQYGDIAIGAKENFNADISDITDFSKLDILKQYNNFGGNYASPCEEYQTILDGKQSVLPSELSDTKMIWSEQYSSADGTFTSPIVIELTSNNKYTSIGITLFFDIYNNVYPKNINVKWYEDNSLLSEKDFQPNNAKYFCENKVVAYNKIVITVKDLNVPYNRLKLTAIDYGYGTVFNRDELQNVKVIQEIDPLSESIVYNVCDFTLNNKQDINFSFSMNQPVTVLFNDNLIATAFVEKASRKAENIWEVNTYDYVALLDNINFMGGIYTDKPLTELLDELLTANNVPYSISEDLENETITGYIPICTGREALQLICFALCAVANTFNSDVLKIYKLPTEVSQVLPKNRVWQSQSFSEESLVTEVQLKQYSYGAFGEPIDVYTAENDGKGENIRIEFGEPLFNLKIYGSEGAGEFALDEFGKEIKHTNYCVINVRGDDFRLTAQKYYVPQNIIKSKKNPDITINDKSNVIKIESQTLVTSKNIDTVLEWCYNYYMKRNRATSNIVQNRHILKYGEAKYGERKYAEVIYDTAVNLSDMVTIPTYYMGDVTGQIYKTTFDLNGNIIVKECELMW